MIRRGELLYFLLILNINLKKQANLRFQKEAKKTNYDMVLVKDKSNGSDINNGLAEEKHNEREEASISIMKDVVECALVAKIGEKESAIEHNEKMEDSKIYVETKGNQFIDESTKEEKTTKLQNQMPSNEEEPQQTDEDSDSD